MRLSSSAPATLSAGEAAALLAVKPATLYTYVSRGLLRSLPGEDGRSRRYLRAEVEHLLARSEAARGHGAAARGALGWGQPVVDTAVGTIGPEGPVYRGLPAARLLDAGFEAACDTLWRPAPPPGAWQQPVGARRRPGPPPDRPIAQLCALVAERGLVLRWVEELDGVELARAAARLVRSGACALGATPSGSIAAGLAAGWDCAAATADLDAALVWCADHELNASTFAARVAASTGAGLHAVVLAALATLSGRLHGGSSREVQALFDAVAARGCAEEVVASWHRRAAPLPGLGHPLYPDGDPRAQDLLDRAAAAGGPGWEPIDSLLDTLVAQGQPPPDLDFGLAALCRAWGLPDGAPRALFALGRMAGWVAHLQEQREQDQLIRPRARYTGPPVETG